MLNAAVFGVNAVVLSRRAWSTIPVGQCGWGRWELSSRNTGRDDHCLHLLPWPLGQLGSVPCISSASYSLTLPGLHDAEEELYSLGPTLVQQLLLLLLYVMLENTKKGVSSGFMPSPQYQPEQRE